jgi:hypothetical protein
VSAAAKKGAIWAVVAGGGRRAEELIEEVEVRETILLGFREGGIQGVGRKRNTQRRQVA